MAIKTTRKSKAQKLKRKLKREISSKRKYITKYKDIKEIEIDDLNKKYSLHEIIKGDSLFCATGITSGELVSGVRQQNGKFYTETLVAQKGSIIDIVIQEEPST